MTGNSACLSLSLSHPLWCPTSWLEVPFLFFFSLFPNHNNYRWKDQLACCRIMSLWLIYDGGERHAAPPHTPPTFSLWSSVWEKSSLTLPKTGNCRYFPDAMRMFCRLISLSLCLYTYRYTNMCTFLLFLFCTDLGCFLYCLPERQGLRNRELTDFILD